jgi:hypothetical protein
MSVNLMFWTIVARRLDLCSHRLRDEATDKLGHSQRQIRTLGLVLLATQWLSGILIAREKVLDGLLPNELF